MRTPAALIGGSIVPLGFVNTPLIKSGDCALTKRLKHLHMLIASFSLSAEIVAVIYSTIAINKLSEAPALPAKSVMELLKRDYELQWLGCNLNFLVGTLGFAALLGLRFWFCFGARFGKIGLFSCASVLCHVLSIINRGIATGDGRGDRFSSNFAGLCLRYLTLLCRDTIDTKSILQLLAALFLGVTLYLYAQVGPHDTTATG